MKTPIQNGTYFPSFLLFLENRYKKWTPKLVAKTKYGNRELEKLRGIGGDIAT
jgi:hypothetical protein